MSEYLSPGVYVHEVPSAVKPIAGVGTRTACFLGIVPDSIDIPEENENYDPTGRSKDPDSVKPYLVTPFKFPKDEDLTKTKQVAQQAQKEFDDNKDPAKMKDLVQKLKDAEDAK